MKYYIVVFVFMLLGSCDNNNSDDLENVSLSAENEEVDFNFYIQDKNGLDLLNPENEGAYALNDIRIYKDAALINDISDAFKRGEEETFFFKNALDYSIQLYSAYGFNVTEVENEGLVFGENTYYLQLSETDVDTLKVETSFTPFWMVSKFVYNNKIVFESPENKVDADNVIIK